MNNRTTSAAYRMGIDLGGTKIAGVVLDEAGRVRCERRIPAPRDDYRTTLHTIAALVADLEAASGGRCHVGIGMPGSIAPATGRVQGSNSTWLNGMPFHADIEAALGRPVRTANDANCFALSEASDGAAAGARSVFGVILGTGCGGGLVLEGKLVDGPNRIGGEWGHMPLPWQEAEETPAPSCWCGRRGCMELWVSGTGISADHARTTGRDLRAQDIVSAAADGDAAAEATLRRHAGRLARGLAVVVDIVDPEVIVLGGGLSNMAHLYGELPDLMRPWIFADAPAVDIRPPRWGDASGVRGAARLW